MDDETLRFELAWRCFDRLGDAEQAVQAAARLERYIRGRAARPASGASAPSGTSGMGNDTVNGRVNGDGMNNAEVKPDAAKPATPKPSAAKPATTKPGRGAGKKNRWTPETDARLRQLWESGAETGTIAAELNRTPASVRERARRLQLPRRKRYRVDAPDDDARGILPRPVRTAPPPVAANEGSHESRRAAPAAPRKRGKTRNRADAAKPAAIQLSAYQEARVRRPEMTLATVINFVRSRGYVVVQAESGEIVVDGHRRFAPADFIAWANSLCRQLHKPAFPADLHRRAG